MLEIERLIKNQGISQNELAQEAHMHPSSVNLIVKGRMKPYPAQRDKLENYARTIGWDEISDLFSEVER